MENRNCNLISDLIPLYVDEICSEESKKMVEEHLKTCTDCRKLKDTMKTGVKITGEKEKREEDARVIKRIKRRIWIERIVIVILTLIVAGDLMLASLLNFITREQNMNDMVAMNDVYIEEDSDGNLWLVRSGNAAMATAILKEVYTPEGELVFSMSKDVVNELEEDKIYQMKVIFMENTISYYTQKMLGIETCAIEEEKSMFLPKEKLYKYEEIVIEQTDGTQKVLWERE